MSATCEQVIRFEQKRGNIYRDTLRRLAKYCSNMGQPEVARIIVLNINEADANVFKAHDEIFGKQQ